MFLQFTHFTKVSKCYRNLHSKQGKPKVIQQMHINSNLGLEAGESLSLSPLSLSVCLSLPLPRAVSEGD